MTWNPDEFGGVEKIRVHANDIWIPDVMLINTYVTMVTLYCYYGSGR